jgi:hypothetical protein
MATEPTSNTTNKTARLRFATSPKHLMNDKARSRWARIWICCLRTSMAV